MKTKACKHHHPAITMRFRRRINKSVWQRWSCDNSTWNTSQNKPCGDVSINNILVKKPELSNRLWCNGYIFIYIHTMQANSALASVTMENKTICPDKSVEAVAVPKRRAHSTCWVRLEVLRFIMWRNTSVETYSSKRQDTFPTQRRSDITHDRSGDGHLAFGWMVVPSPDHGGRLHREGRVVSPSGKQPRWWRWSLSWTPYVRSCLLSTRVAFNSNN